MKQYIGTKIIQAETHHVDGEAGYTIVYNNGYRCWAHKHSFENTYRPSDNLPFGLAMEAMKKCLKVARHGWNGIGMFIFNVPGSTFKVNRAPLLGIYPEGTEITYHSHIDMKTVDGTIVPWVCSQTDMAADDWFIVE